MSDILKLSARLVREACGMEDDEPVTVGGAEATRKTALAAVRERDNLHAQLRVARIALRTLIDWKEDVDLIQNYARNTLEKIDGCVP